MATDLSSEPTVSLLLSRGQSLLSSLSALQRHLRRTSLDRQVEVRPFATALRSELSFLESLEKTAEKDDAAAAAATAPTSNLSHLELIWRYARTQLGVRGICKTFSYHQHPTTTADATDEAGKKKKEKRQVTVDVVSQNGLTWTKVCSLTPGRIRRYYEQDVSALVKTVEALLAAAKNERVQYLHPEVVVYFPNLTRADAGACGLVDRLVACGVSVRLEDDGDLVRPRLQDDDVEEMVRPVVDVTGTVNLDVTALLALVSDITHDPAVVPEEWLHPAILAQISAERDGLKMSHALFPALRGKDLVAAEAAKKRFCQIVDIFGSEGEKKRMELVLNGAGEEDDVSALGFGGMDLKFPVKIVEDEIEPEGDVQAKVMAKLSTVNRAVFMTGWKKGFTTVTSNKTIAKAIEGLIEDGEQGPDMLVLNASRSLVGKGKSIDIQ